MIYQLTGYKGWHRRYLGILPLQFCMVCGKVYWGGLPRWSLQPISPADRRLRIRNTWQASWQDYCSQQCAEDDGRAIAAMAELGPL